MNDHAASIVPTSPSTRLRRAAADDQAFARHLFKASRAADFAAAGLPEAMLETLLEQQFRAQSAGYAAQFPDAITLIILQRDEPVGRLMLVTGARCWRVIDIVLLVHVRGAGIGTDIIDAVARAAQDHGAEALTLSVLSSNTGARRLYARLGFVETSEGVHIEMRRLLTA